MVFEDNFVYSFPNIMYDPALKVRVHTHAIREAGPEDVMIVIYYDSGIEADNLTVPVSEDTKAFWRSRPQDAHKADDDSICNPFMSNGEVKVGEVPCYWKNEGDIVRAKISLKGETFVQIRRIIESLNIPQISRDPLSFLIHVLKKYINLSGLPGEYYSEELCPHTKRVEICLNADAFLGAFELSPADYAEVEPGWYCLASKEVVR